MLLGVPATRLVGVREDGVTQPLLEETSREDRLEFKLELDVLFAYDSLFAGVGGFGSILIGVLELTLSTETG